MNKTKPKSHKNSLIVVITFIILLASLFYVFQNCNAFSLSFLGGAVASSDDSSGIEVSIYTEPSDTGTIYVFPEGEVPEEGYSGNQSPLKLDEDSTFEKQNTPPNIVYLGKKSNLSEVQKNGDCLKGDFRCTDWGPCETTYSILDLIFNRYANSIQKRLCFDSSGCFSSFFEEKNCPVKEEVIVDNKIWCNQQYIELEDKEGIILTRLNPIRNAGKISGVYISLVLGNEGYCSYCFDGIKDYDEEDIDCGGSCKSCY